MLKRKDIVKEYNLCVVNLKLKPKELIVGAGAACLMYGLRDETSDIDTSVPSDIFEKLLKSKKYELSYFGESEVLAYNHCIDLHRRSSFIDIRSVDGVWCYSPQELLNQKLKLNRPKDQNDIKELKILVEKERRNLSVSMLNSGSKSFPLFNW